LIGSADLDGANSRIVLSSPEMLKHPFSITLFGDWMYWSDWDRNAIFQADKFNGQRASLVANSSMIPMVIHVYHPYRQPEAQNHCLPLNGRCSHVCLPAPQLTANSAKTSCACPRGLRLDNDNLNCIHDHSFDPVVRDDNGDDEPSASSARSKVKSRVRNEHNQGFLAGVAIGAAAGALVLLAILGMALYRKFWCKSLHSINFDNPVYRKSAEEAVNLERDPSSVSMTSTVTTSNMSASSSVVVGAKRSYTSNTLATDVSEEMEVEPLNCEDPNDMV